MKTYLPLLVAGAVVLATSAQAARVATVPITHEVSYVYQAYGVESDYVIVASPGNGVGENTGFAGYLSSGDPVTEAVPGVLAIEPGSHWSNFVGAAQAGIPNQIDDPSALQAWSIKNVVLRKTYTPGIQCADVFTVKNIPQQGTPNIRLWWPLMYEAPGTTWTLTILYGTTQPWDDDGAGPNPAGYAHTEVWTWKVDADLAHLSNLLALFHAVPFGLDEVGLISDEVLYPQLQCLVDSAAAALAAGDKVSAGLTLTELELTVMDACISVSPAFPNPTGATTGIANTRENPACCKILVDIEYIGKATGAFQTKK